MTLNELIDKLVKEQLRGHGGLSVEIVVEDLSATIDGVEFNDDAGPCILIVGEQE